MTDGTSLHLLVRMLEVAITLALPFLAAALVAGVLAGMAQASTGVCDPAVSQVPRVLAAAAAIALAGPWVLAQMAAFFGEVLADFSPYVRQ